MKKAVIHGNTRLNYSWFYLTTKQGLELNGYNVKSIDFKTTPLDKVEEKLFEIEPDILFTHLSFHGHQPIEEILGIYENLREYCGTKIIHTLGDARPSARFDGNISYSFDIALVNQIKNLNKFEKHWKIPCYYWPYSSLTYDKTAEPVRQLSFSDPVFTGHPGAHQDRSSFIRRLQGIMKIKIFETQSSNDMRHNTPELAASAKCILGLCTGYGNDIYGYVDVRPFQYLGTGAFMIMRKYPVMDEIFPQDIYVGFDNYNDPLKVKKLFEKWSRKDTSEMRQKAFNFIQKYHSCKVRLRHTLELIEGKRNNIPVLLKDLEG